MLACKLDNTRWLRVLGVRNPADEGANLAFWEKLCGPHASLRCACEVIFSLYFSALLIGAEENRDLSWSTKFRLWYFSHRYPQAPKPIDSRHFERFVAFVVAWVLVIVIFAFLRLMNRFPRARVASQWFVGLVSLCGLPVALLYDGFGDSKLLLIMAGVSAVLVFLYVSEGWQLSTWVNLSLLCLYFIFATWIAWRSWVTFPLAFFVLWPGLDWIPGTYPVARSILPLLGLLLSGVWAVWVKETQSGGYQQH